MAKAVFRYALVDTVQHHPEVAARAGHPQHRQKFHSQWQSLTWHGSTLSVPESQQKTLRGQQQMKFR